MSIVKRTIQVSDLKNSSNGYVYLNIFLTQDIDDMGVFTDAEFIESTTTSVNKKDIYKGYRPNFEKKAWYKAGSKITTTTDSKLHELKGYKSTNRYKKGFDLNKETYTNYKGDDVSGVSRITSNDNETVYVFDANNDGVIGSEDQNTGLLYKDYENGVTTVTYNAEGINDTNSSLSAITKEEYLMGIISEPEIKNDVFIDRGETIIAEPHLRLGEIKNLDQLERYGNGYFNVK
jgi:hypothetical protein